MSFQQRPGYAGFLALCLFALPVSPATAQDAPPPARVGVMTLEKQTVPRVVTLPGRAVAYQSVDIRPRVGGVIEEILYSPGDMLDAGTPLFRIDDAASRATVASARADLAKAEANLPVAQSAYDRASELAGRGYTEAEVEATRAALSEARATLEAAEAALEYAETELSWTTITSPISGVGDLAEVSVGDLVTSGQSEALTTITQLDPIDVDMLEASARMLSVREDIDAGVLSMQDHLEAKLVLETGQVYRGTGQLVSPGTAVSTSTGSFTVRFRFDNPDRQILPGMFLRGEITLGTTDAFLVPQRAAQRGNSGQLTVYVVGEDGTSRQVLVEDSGTYDNSWIIRDGLSEGDQLILDGLKSMAPGQPVTPVTASVDEDGLVQDAAAESEGN